MDVGDLEVLLHHVDQVDWRDMYKYVEHILDKVEKVVDRMIELSSLNKRGEVFDALYKVKATVIGIRSSLTNALAMVSRSSPHDIKASQLLVYTFYRYFYGISAFFDELPEVNEETMAEIRDAYNVLMQQGNQ